MSGRVEALTDIENELRNPDPEEICPWLSDGGVCSECPLGNSGALCSFRNLADRINKAGKHLDKEIEFQKRRADYYQEAQKFGNIAILRDALVKIKKIADEGWQDTTKAKALDDIYELANNALDMPARNCDKFGGDYKMLRTAWYDWTCSPSGQNSDGSAKMTFDEWLLSNEKTEPR